VLTGTVLLAGQSGPVDRATHMVLRADRRLTAVIWHPLLHGGGWAGPVIPPLVSPSPSHPAVSPSAPRSPAPRVVAPTPTVKASKRK
jgi:hypothetical protein